MPDSTPGPMELTPAQRRELRDALLAAFDRADLTMMVGDFLEERYDVLVERSKLSYEVFQLIDACTFRGTVSRLVFGALATRPANPKLQAFARRLGLSSTDAPATALEKLVGKNRTFLDVDAWRSALVAQEWRVCQVRRGGAAIGTGFLVGPGAVLTNHHVLAQAIESGRHEPYSFVFDYRRTGTGIALHAGTSVELAQDWLIACSPPSPVDEQTDPKSRQPTDDELDFALVRLAGDVGEEPPGGGEHGEPRGWMELSTTPYPFDARSGIAILQHPQGEPLKLALDLGTTASLNHPDDNRVRYDVSTLPGSSGSPVFDAETFRLVALHHAGDPAWTARYNQGIPIAKIAAHAQVAAWLAEEPEGRPRP